ncbi:thyrotropin-releasing hormone receptor-like [Lineus longissimus]|uniref:thyrotropin-releasing hormone receptor-like n=1 Tax=Lineus longissimus TaxID=88925 RepID=UPI00315CC2C7
MSARGGSIIFQNTMDTMDDSAAKNTSLTFNNEADELPEHPLLFLLYTILSRYIWIVPVVLGVPGNVLSILVANRKHNRALSPCVYMKAMAVADTLELLEHVLGLTVMYSEPGQNIVHMRDAFYKYHYYLGFVFAMLSGFFLAQMSIDRLIAVRFPLAAPGLCTTPRAIKTVVITTVLVVIFNLYVPFVVVYYKNPITGAEILVFQVPEHIEIEILASLSQLLLGTVIPFVIILGCNIIIIITVRTASAKRAKISAGQGQGNRKEETHLTRMLIFVSLAYMVTSIPYRLYYLVMDMPELGDVYDMNDEYWNLRYLVQVFFVFNLWMFNYAINFYLYCIGGGAKYRRDAAEVCKEIVPCCFKCR